MINHLFVGLMIKHRSPPEHDHKFFRAH
jgi:hypothetical protein